MKYRALPKITPIHEAIDDIDRTIKILIRTKAALMATLPQQKKRKITKEDRCLIDPRTGKKGYF